jgi:hypothetical protein
MIRKLINTGLAATLILLPIVNVGKAKAQNANVDAYLIKVNLELDAYINSTIVAKNSGLPSYFQTIKTGNCIVIIRLATDLQNGVIAGAISPQKLLYQNAVEKIRRLGQMSNCPNF